MFKIKILDSNLDKLKEYSMVSIRIALGVVFLGHGGQKLFGLFGGNGLSGTIGFMKMLGFHPAAFWGTALACAEFFGGLFALLGLFTRWAGFSLAIVMSVAVFTVHLKNGLFLANRGFEYAGSLLCMAIALIICGGGKLSLDNFFKK
jgi:putative oxidoreductase